MAFLGVGLNHKTAPVAVRERLAFADQTLAEPLARWHDPAVEDVVILSKGKQSRAAGHHWPECASVYLRLLLVFVRGKGRR
jgi:hypothetical protein